MKYLKRLFLFFTAFFFCIFIIYLILPKGWIFLRILDKKGIKLYTERVKETFLGFELHNIVLDTASILNQVKMKRELVFFLTSLKEVKISKLKFWGNTIYVPCGKNGFLKIFYYPLKNLKMIVKNFEGRCIGIREVEKISGTVFYTYPKTFNGELKIDRSLLIRFKKDRMIIKTGKYERVFKL